MKALKILNNSFILAQDAKNTEVMVMGKGIGFHHKKGDEISPDKIEKIFILKTEIPMADYIHLLQTTPPDYINAVHEIINRANAELNGKLHDQLFITLLDHLTYAIDRLKKGIHIQNKLLWEVKKFYPSEYAIAVDCITYLNKELNIELPEEEAGNIAFHLVNAQTDSQQLEQTMQSMKMMKDIFSIIQYFYGIRINEKMLHYARFLAHIQFFIQRVLEGHMLEEKNNHILESLIKDHEQAVKCAEKIDEYIHNILNIKISREEFLYLVIHIIRVVPE